MTTQWQIGQRVQGGTGEDHDTGRIEAIGGQCDDAHQMNRPGNVYVKWDSLVETWTPAADLQPE